MERNRTVEKQNIDPAIKHIIWADFDDFMRHHPRISSKVSQSGVKRVLCTFMES